MIIAKMTVALHRWEVPKLGSNYSIKTHTVPKKVYVQCIPLCNENRVNFWIKNVWNRVVNVHVVAGQNCSLGSPRENRVENVWNQHERKHCSLDSTIFLCALTAPASLTIFMPLPMEGEKHIKSYNLTI